MGRSDILHVPSAVERCGDGFDLIVFGGKQMQAAQDEMYRLSGRRLRSFGDRFNGWMTAAYDEHHAIGRIDCQGNFLHLKVNAPFAVQENQMEARRNFGRLADP